MKYMDYSFDVSSCCLSSGKVVYYTRARPHVTLVLSFGCHTMR